MMAALLLWALSRFFFFSFDSTEAPVPHARFSGLALALHANYRPSMLVTYWDGAREGWELSFYPSGQLESERGFRHGLFQGRVQSWYENGRIRTFRSYAEGLADGEQWVWGPEGQVLEYNVYQKDQEIVHKTWTFDGRPFHNYVYQKGEKVGVMGEPFCKRRKQL